MKVGFDGVFNPYRKSVTNEKSAKGASSSEPKKASGSEDVSELRLGSTAIDTKSYATLKARLQSEINAPASAERLESLRTAIKGGTYRISTEDLVNAVLGQ